MKERTTRYKLPAEGQATIDAVDGYLDQVIREGRPIEALIATRRLGEITSDRAREAAQVATDGPWSWKDVGWALGVSKQAAHERLRARVQNKMDKARSKLDRAEKVGHSEIARRAQRGREKLDELPQPAPKAELARQELDEWERRKHEKLSRDLQNARKELARAEQTVQSKVGNKDSAA